MRPRLHLSGCLACFLTDIPTRLWTQMEIHLLPVPSWLVFLFYSHLLAPPSQELVCQRKPCTSLHAYQTVYPFPVGAFLHLWLSQPIATPRVHSKSWFRHPALPASLPSLTWCSSHARCLVLTFCHSLTHFPSSHLLTPLYSYVITIYLPQHSAPDRKSENTVLNVKWWTGRKGLMNRLYVYIPQCLGSLP